MLFYAVSIRFVANRLKQKSMKRCLILWIFLVITASVAAQKEKQMENESLIVKESPFTVAETSQRIEKILKEKEIPVFAVFDHAKNARETGLSLPPTRVIVFGSPQVGTKLMQEFPEIAIELPLKIAVWENKEGQTRLSFPSLIPLARRYGIAEDNPIVQGMSKLLENLTEKAVSPSD